MRTSASSNRSIRSPQRTQRGKSVKTERAIRSRKGSPRRVAREMGRLRRGLAEDTRPPGLGNRDDTTPAVAMLAGRRTLEKTAPPPESSSMLLPLLLFAQTTAAAAPATLAGQAQQAVYVGTARQMDVRIPSFAAADAGATVDGRLDEPVWSRAAVLTGFSMYQPVDSRPAPDSTQVLVWYAPDAIWFGIRAFEPHAGVRATLSNRDQISNDDNVEIHLDTFDERRRAYVFIVNPLGVQADGMKNEGAGLFLPGQHIEPGQNDLSPDFIWQSKGHLTDYGYEVELRIPFKSLRYPAQPTEDWGVQVVRNVQHSGYQETWTPVHKASASFIVQEGKLVGMSGMRHGEVVELNPEFTTSVDGGPADASTGAVPGAWQYHTSPTLGGNARLGLGSNFVLNGTIKPDFSQVEADALQIAGDARFDVFYAEKRPFFVDGIEQFAVPNTLVYTRRIVHPTAAARLTGKIGRTDVAVLSALDDPQTSLTGGHDPAWNLVRLKRDFAEQSFAGILLGDREDGADFNRYAEADLRHVFGRLYYLELQAVGSATRRDDTTRTAPMWEAAVDRTGRSFGFHYQLTGIDPDFYAASGFVPRTNIVNAQVANRYTLYGHPDAVFEQYNTFITTNAIWRYRDFFAAKSLLEDRFSMSNSFTFRGGWKVGLSPALSTYAFDPAAYAGYYVPSDSVFATPRCAPFRPSDRITTFTVGPSVSTPQFQHVVASAGFTVGNDVDFFETSRVRRFDTNANVDWRPTEKLRVGGSYVSSRFTRRADGATIVDVRIPRLKVEYQLARPLFVRFVGQYDSHEGAPLRDPRTGGPIYTQTGGVYTAATHQAGNGLRVDWLFSYRPTPGTVFFAGYGSTMTEPEPLRFGALHRQSDGFFVKGSYLLRM